MLKFKDQCQREVLLQDFPLRIVSTVPSQTELLCDLGLEKQLVGITAYCVHPKNLLSEKTIIGGTKNLNIDLIRNLKPDLIIANKEENIKEQIEDLSQGIPVWISDVENFDQGLELISEIGKLTNTIEQAKLILKSIKKELPKTEIQRPLKTLYFIWKNPFMLAGNSTYIGNMVEFNGLQNIAPKTEDRYPQIAFDKLKELDPELILLTSEPYSFKSLEAHEIAQVFPNALVKIVDGEMFTWYGSRMVLAMKYFSSLQKGIQLYFK